MVDSEMRLIMQRIRDRRKELGMSYQDLSNKTGISKSSLQRYETGFIKNMPLDKLKIMASALQCSPSYLMGWIDDPIDYDNIDDLYVPEEYAKLGMDAEDYYKFKQAETEDGLGSSSFYTPYSHLSDNEINILKSFNRLNDTGKKEAQKRITELTLIPQYTNSKALNTAARSGKLDKLPDSELIDNDIKNADEDDFI